MALCLCVAAASAARAAGDESAGDDSGSAAPSPAPKYRHLVELKRSATDRGTSDETTKTNLKFDYLLTDGAVSFLRLELPFPDKKTTFEGSPFNPALGDIKTRIGWRAVDVGGRPTTSFLELTYPTANPSSLGAGKYQVSVGAEMSFRLGSGPTSVGSPVERVLVQIQQVVSFAGDDTRKDIDQTKFEVTWRNTWKSGNYAKATAKPVIDWVGGGQTGAVLELEGGWAADRHWTLVLLGGGLLWGQGVPGTYGTRVEAKAVYRY